MQPVDPLEKSRAPVTVAPLFLSKAVSEASYSQICPFKVVYNSKPDFGDLMLQLSSGVQVMSVPLAKQAWRTSVSTAAGVCSM